MSASWLDIVQTVVSGATAAGVVALFWQVELAKRQAITAFEDDLTRQYREIAHRIPVEALLNEELDDAKLFDTLTWFYQYIDLSNEQVFLRQKGRVRRETWEVWCDGIKSNLSRPAFAKAWGEIKKRSLESFEELRRLEQSGFRDDPKVWGGRIV
ncbi:MAG TPA: hypothetical protein VFD30_01095 [Terriglobia bacterium]|nr:hypothetical protein [Terriglobia bacterium]